MGEYDENGNPVREYVHLNGEPLAQVDTHITYLHTDQWGTLRRATDESGQVVWSWDSEAFGSQVADPDPDGDGELVAVNLRFPGQYYDSESGLHYNYFRYYDPSTGRYITSDPIGLYGGLNTYGYVGSNPLIWFDSMGLAAECIFSPLSFKYSPSGQYRYLDQRDWTTTLCGPIAEFGAPTPPGFPRGSGNSYPGIKPSPLDFIFPPFRWKCQNTYHTEGVKQQLYTAMAWGVLRCYDDCGNLVDETYGYKRWEDADEWRTEEEYYYESPGPIYPK